MGEAQPAHLPLDVQCRRLLLAHGLAEPHQVTPGASSHSDGAPDLHGGGSHQAQLGRGVRQALLSVGGQQARAPVNVFQLCHQALKGLYGLLQALSGPPLFLQNSGAQAQREGIALRKMPISSSSGKLCLLLIVLRQLWQLVLLVLFPHHCRALLARQGEAGQGSAGQHRRALMDSADASCMQVACVLSPVPITALPATSRLPAHLRTKAQAARLPLNV